MNKFMESFVEAALTLSFVVLLIMLVIAISIITLMPVFIWGGWGIPLAIFAGIISLSFAKALFDTLE